MKIEVKHKRRWGKDRYYPENIVSSGILKLMHRKTFTLAQLKLLRKIEFIVEIEYDEPQLGDV